MRRSRRIKRAIKKRARNPNAADDFGTKTKLGDLSTKPSALQIKQHVSRYFTEKNYAVHFEVGLLSAGTLRADVLAMNMGQRLVIVEVKSSVQDFTTDKKWQQYAKYCDQFYFAMGRDTYDKLKKRDKLPRCGVFVVDGTVCHLYGRSSVVKINDPEVRQNLVTRMAYRSANVTRYAIRAKTSGAELVADTVIAAIRSVPKEIRKTDAVRRAIIEAISHYV